MLPKVLRTSGATRMHSCVRERLTFCDSGFLPLSADPRTAVVATLLSGPKKRAKTTHSTDSARVFERKESY